MLNQKDFKSIWEIAHLWEGLDPAVADSETPLPEEVIDKTQKLIWGFLRKQFHLRTPSGRKVFQDVELFLFFNVSRTRVRLIKYLEQRVYPKSELDQLFIFRSEFLKWCEDEYLDPPAFWQPSLKGRLLEKKSAIGRHANEEIDKQLCAAIAQTLWSIDPNIHPAHMAKSWYIQKLGNGAQYKDEETVKGWIAPYDPLRGQRKSGRPPNEEYKIDLLYRQRTSEKSDG